jgi:hypothetical protein
MKKGTTKKRIRDKIPKKEKEKLRVERKVRERRKWTSVLWVRRTPLSEKRHKKSRIMDMCPRVSSSHFSKIISEGVIMDVCLRLNTLF